MSKDTSFFEFAKKYITGWETKYITIRSAHAGIVEKVPSHSEPIYSKDIEEISREWEIYKISQEKKAHRFPTELKDYFKF